MDSGIFASPFAVFEAADKMNGFPAATLGKARSSSKRHTIPRRTFLFLMLSFFPGNQTPMKPG
jgi:hypothetical protein